MNGSNPWPEWVVEMRPGLQLLWRAESYARQEGRPRWHYAVELRELSRASLTTSDLRRLLYHGFVEHADEVIGAKRSPRSFRPTRGKAFGPQTCFVLTETGAAMAREVCGEEAESQPRKPAESPVPQISLPDQEVLPRWDSAARELWLGDMLVKRFPRLAPNQRTILDTFEEEGWVRHIDDPLTGDPDCDAKERLRNTVRALNHSQLNPLIHFRADGTGEGVFWERLPPSG